MKKITVLLSTVLMIGVLFSGCNKAKELLDLKFKVNYDTDLTVSVPEGSRNLTFNKKLTVDPVSNPTVEKYIDKIKDIEILELSAEVTSISKNIILVTGQLDIYNDTRSTGWSFENVEIKKGAKFDLNNDNGQWDVLSDILMDQEVFTEEMTGEVDQGGVTFSLKIKMRTKITVNPL